MKMTKKELEESSIDSRIIDIIYEYILGVSNDGSDLSEPHLRPSLTKNYQLVVFSFSLLIVVGLLANCIVLFAILRNKMYRDATHSFVLNNAICDILKCLFVIPLSVYVLLVQNWVLGELMCSFLPMIQDMPFHVTTLTFTLMAWDRLRFIRNPNQIRLPAFVCCFGTWLSSMCLVLPYPLYVVYVDIGNYLPEMKGVGICVYNLIDDMEEYIRGIFLTMYAAPMCLVSYLYIRSSQQLKNRQNASSANNTSSDRSIHGHRLLQRESRYMNSSINSRSSNENYQESDRDIDVIPKRKLNLDIVQEKKMQRYLVFTVTFYGICLCPIMVMKLARFAFVETYENSGLLDIIYTVFVWIAYLPVCVTPLVHLMWQLSCLSKDTLKGHFSLVRREKQSCDTLDILDSGPFRKRLELEEGGSSSLVEESCGS